jgi:hypothetical protein
MHSNGTAYRPGDKSQWLVGPELVIKEEKLRKTKLVRRARRLKRISARDVARI